MRQASYSALYDAVSDVTKKYEKDIDFLNIRTFCTIKINLISVTIF